MIAGIDHALNHFFASLGAPMEGVARLILATIFGGLIGMERELRGRQAGLRTFILVSVGSALAMLVSVEFALRPWPAEPGVIVSIDPARIAYGVMTGIGFIGAGAIVHAEGGLIRGLTTAAGLWCAAAIGLCAGLGMYLLLIVASVGVLGILWLLEDIEKFLPRARFRALTIRTRYAAGVMEQLANFARVAHMHVTDAHLTRTDDLIWADIDLRVRYTRLADFQTLELKLEQAPDYQLMATREV